MACFTTMLIVFCASIILLSIIRCAQCQTTTVDNSDITADHLQFDNDQLTNESAANHDDMDTTEERTPIFDVNTDSYSEADMIDKVWQTIVPLGRSARDTADITTLDEIAMPRKKIGGTKFGRKKLGKKKSLRWLYPVFIGVIISKIILLPMIIKAVTFMSSTSFILSKMSLLATVILGLKFFLTNNNHAKMNDSRVEIIHVPMKKDYSSTWDRDTAENKIHPQYHPQETPSAVEVEFKPTQYMNMK